MLDDWFWCLCVQSENRQIFLRPKSYQDEVMAPFEQSFESPQIIKKQTVNSRYKSLLFVRTKHTINLCYAKIEKGDDGYSDKDFVWWN